ncbi:Protein suppressor of white apricot [Trachymyrmex septentrionalis]|uniref:Protein suppressor of white apricot n=1 Tax=Trachymyrmex septentrionalis TaxID=34720 RepID=A0A195FDB6_9HYME|nr:Protein suppressor of white apricot [Trachymyrmex septentrionalis]
MASSKSQRWMVDSGILRKKNSDEEPQELLVFGYSCKLFRDDDKAKMIDQGKHLIPWMGDNTLRIDRCSLGCEKNAQCGSAIYALCTGAVVRRDAYGWPPVQQQDVLYVYRYDGRGALADLRIHEPPPGGFDQRTILTEEELKVEQLCDEERYRSIYNNDAEESMYHEEEIKRLHQALDSESSYNQVGYNYNEDENGHKASGEDSQSSKQSEGSQEEDQAFVPPPELEIPEGMILPETQKLNAIIMKTALFISQHGSQLEILIKTKQANNPQFAFLSIDEPLHQYYKYVLDAIKSGKYNPEKQPEKEESEPEEESDQDDESYLHPSLASSLTKIEAAPSIPSIQYKPSADCAYSMLVNKITGKPPPSKTPQGLDATMQSMPSTGYYHTMPPQSYPYPTPMQYSHGPVIYGSNGQMQSPSQLAMPIMPNDTATSQTSSPKETPTPLVPYGIPAQKPLSRPSFIVPPADVQIIIDKMASYVAKNGRDFETIVKNKGDPRFNFLELSHQYHGYYAHKLTVYEGAINPKVLTEEQLLQKQEPQEEKQKKLEELQKKQQRMEEVQKRVKMIQAKKKNGGDPKIKQSTGSAKQITTVSFSIKKPKDGENTVIEKRNALPLEESDEEMESDKKDTNSKPGSPEDSTADASFSIAIGDKDLLKLEKKLKSDDKELVDLTDDILEDCQKEIRQKQAQEDRIKDKLAAAARDKLLSKERQLQLERKKRAAIFLSNIQTPALKTGSTTMNPNSRKDDSDEVHSVPSPSLEDNKDRSSQYTKTCSNSLMDRLKSADLSGKRSRQRSRSRSGSRTDRHKLHKKHKKKKSSHRR